MVYSCVRYMLQSVHGTQLLTDNVRACAVPRIVPSTRLAMLAGEYQISRDFKTEVKGWGLPRHTVIMTNKRMIVSCKQCFLWFVRHEWETSVLYKCVTHHVPCTTTCRIHTSHSIELTCSRHCKQNSIEPHASSNGRCTPTSKQRSMLTPVGHCKTCTHVFVCRDVIDISIGHMRDRKCLLFALLCIAFGSLLFTWCVATRHLAAAFTMLGIFGTIGVSAIGKYLAEELLTEGDDLIVDVCKCALVLVQCLLASGCCVG